MAQGCAINPRNDADCKTSRVLDEQRAVAAPSSFVKEATGASAIRGASRHVPVCNNMMHPVLSFSSNLTLGVQMQTTSVIVI
jgi:hypothetical protein